MIEVILGSIIALLISIYIWACFSFFHKETPLFEKLIGTLCITILSVFFGKWFHGDYDIVSVCTELANKQLVCEEKYQKEIGE